ncbi:MAG: molybdenum cofactor biosynthesis protein MoaE [Pirellula sp.]|jgi:molybdopterin synthase catalytic subunit
MIELVRESIDLNRISTYCAMDRVGAVSMFVGITRRYTGDIETLCLEYDAYESMAKSKMIELSRLVEQKWHIERFAFVHRLGRVAVGETSMVVAVGSAHRANAIRACEWLVERIKVEVPIWKKEFYPSGDSRWIHPTQG